MLHSETRLDPLQSAAVLSFTSLTHNQAEKLNRAFYYYFGHRPLCSKQEKNERKEDRKLRSSSSDTVVLTKGISSKKGISTMKDIECERYICDALEWINRDVAASVKGNKLLKHCFNIPWPFDNEKFTDVILWKIGIDAGGGSTKIILNCCNVEKPQSLKHTHIFGLFKKAKDTYENLKRAFFYEGSLIKNRSEAIINRRCVTLVVTNQDHVEALTFIDTNCSKMISQAHYLYQSVPTLKMLYLNQQAIKIKKLTLNY